MTTEALLAEIAEADRRLVETIDRRLELVLALRRSGPEPAESRPLSEHGLRELRSFVHDLSKREAARAEARRGVARSAPVSIAS